MFHFACMYIITQPSSNCLFFLCHESVNYCPTNHGLVSRFAVQNTHALIDTRDNDVYERRRCATKVKISHALATLNSNNFVVYGQKHKVCVLIFLLDERNILRPKLSRFCFATKPHRLLQLHSRNAAKYFIKRVG